MILYKVRSLKVWLYIYENVTEKEEHKKHMLLGGFNIEKEDTLSIEFSQVIKESE